MELSGWERYLQPCGHKYTIHQRVRRTDGQTDTGRQQRPRLRIASRGKTRSSADADKPARRV